METLLRRHNPETDEFEVISQKEVTELFDRTLKKEIFKNITPEKSKEALRECGFCLE